MRVNHLFLGIIALLFVLSCSKPAQGGGGESGDDLPKTYEIEVEQADDSLYKDQRIVVEGYLRLPFSMFVVSRTPLELYARPNQREGKFLRVELSNTDSTGSGVFKLPSNYTHADLKVLTEQGDTLRGTDRVRLTGRVEWHMPEDKALGPQVVLVVDSIFKGMHSPKPYPELKSVKLDSNLLNDMHRHHTLVHAEGRLLIPSMIFAFKENWLFLEGDFGKVGAHFVTGTGPNCLAPFPEKYKDSDFKVYGSDGNLIDMKKPVRVIGNFTGPDSLTTGDISVEHIEQVQAP